MATQKGPHRNQKVPNFAFHCCDKTPRPKATWGENLSFSSASHSLREVVTGTELELETGGRVLPRVHGGVLLAELCSVVCSSLLSYTLQDHVPRVDTTHNVLGLQQQSQRKSPTGLPTDQPGGPIFSKFSPWKMTWTHVTLTSNWLAQCPSVSDMEYQVVPSAHPAGNWADWKVVICGNNPCPPALNDSLFKRKDGNARIHPISGSPRTISKTKFHLLVCVLIRISGTSS